MITGHWDLRRQLIEEVREDAVMATLNPDPDDGGDAGLGCSAGLAGDNPSPVPRPSAEAIGASIKVHKDG